MYKADIGVHSLANGATVTYLLRPPAAALEADEGMKPYIRAGKAHFVKGDALNAEELAKGWEEACRVGKGTVDLAYFTLGTSHPFILTDHSILMYRLNTGGTPTFHITQGFVITPVDLVTRCFLNFLRTIPPSLRAADTQPKLVAISSGGLTREGHEELPCVMKPFYSYLLAGPHDDKLGAETIAAHYIGRDFTDPVKPEILAPNWADGEGVMGRGSYQKMVIVRPAFLTDGECNGDKADAGGSKAPYKVGENEVTGYTISRKDVAHFIAGPLLREWDHWEGKCVAVTY